MDGKAVWSVSLGWAAAIVVAVAVSADLRADEADGAERVVRSAAGYRADRDPNVLRELDLFEETRIKGDERIIRMKGGSASTASAVLADHWIYDANIEMFFDADDDGFYRYVRVTFDVDSYYYTAWVFAQLYLSADGVTWELYHETDDFLVEGAIADDAYEVETELLSGYPPGEYDLLIELYDADTGVFVDELGPVQTSALALLPLEDREHDQPPPTVIIHDHGGGGAASPALLLLLGVLAAAAARGRRHSPVIGRRAN